MKALSIRENDGRARPVPIALGTIRVEARYAASQQRVFGAWLDPDVARTWLFATATQPIAHVEIDARVAGSFRFVEPRGQGTAEHTGHYVEIAPHRRLVFSLALADRPRILTRVSVELERREGGCKLALTHENVPRALVNATEARWTGILYGLGVTLESFASPAALKRPRLAADAVVRQLARTEAAERRNSQPPRNPRSER
jgi:uncharacterized protein YndB with AHSA1/START domain